MLEDRHHALVSDIARAEKVGRTYVGDILRLTLLAPDIVEAILDGRQPTELGVHVLREGFPVEWVAQRAILNFDAHPAAGALAPDGYRRRPS